MVYYVIAEIIFICLYFFVYLFKALIIQISFALDILYT